MKPKISTGYLTPQAKKTKNSARNRLSDAEEIEEENTGFNENVFQALLKCPEKKKMILQLLSSNKHTIDKFRKGDDGKPIGSPLDKLKAKKKACESPTALLRRRALEQMNSSPSTSNRSDLSRSNSRCSEASSNISTPVPFEEVLEGVIAYVEIRNRQDEDRSGGAKAVLKSMGAQVREKFTNDVTHVIFKDGSYSTFQKAKLMRLHLVSILWVEFCRKTMQKQNEKQYPAMRSGFDDETMICSQMHKEYEDIIREEYRRSIMHGTPLPTTKSLIDRRRTLMTPSVSNLNSLSSTSTFKTALDEATSQEVSDREVARITSFQDSENIYSENLIMNYPEGFSEVSGPIVNGNVVEKENIISPSFMKSVTNIMHSSDMDITHIPQQSAQHRKTLTESDMELTKIPDSSNKTPKRKHSKAVTKEAMPKNRSTSQFDRRKTICNSLLTSDSTTRSLITSDKSISTVSLLSSDKSTNVSDPVPFAVPKVTSRESRRLTSTASLLSSDKSTNVSDPVPFAVPKVTSRESRRLTRASTASLIEPDESFIFGKNAARSKKCLLSELDKTASAMSELKLSSSNNLSKSTEENNSKTSVRRSTSMSSLQLSSESKNKNATSSLSLKLTTESSKIITSSSLEAPKKTRRKSVLPKSSMVVSKYSAGSSMSILRLSSEKRLSDKREESTDSLMSSLQISSMNILNDSPSQRNVGNKSADSFASSEKRSPEAIQPVVEDIIRALQTPEFITIRKRAGPSSRSKSVTSDDSEIISPRKGVFTTKERKLNKSNGILSDNEQDVPQKDPIPLSKTLVVNIIRSPVGSSENTDIQRRVRRRTLGSRKTRKQDDSSIVKTASTKPGKDHSTSSETISSDSANDVSDKSTSSKSRRKLRKLYNPDDSLHLEVDEEKERRKHIQTRKRKSDEGVIINSEDILKGLNKSPRTEAASESDADDLTSPKRSRKVTKKKEKIRPSLNSSADEQKELLNEVLSKKAKAPPKTPRSQTAETPSRRKSTRIIKPTWKLGRSDENVHVPITPVCRRSTLDFMSVSQLTQSRKKFKKKVDKTKLATIVCTKLHKADVQLFTQIVKKLGRFVVEDEVSERTTHLVAGEPKRTINMLRAISRGCWILTFEWVLQSLEERKWLPEEDFEVADFSPSVQKCRLERQAFGARYTLDVFQSCPPIYVALSTNPRSSDLKELITTCKGKIATAPRMAKIVVGQYLQQEGTVCVNEAWVLDCITFYKKLPFKQKYLIANKRKSLIV